jgi:hypothetical protein
VELAKSAQVTSAAKDDWSRAARSDAIQSAGSPIDAIQTWGNDGAAGVSEDAPCSQRVKTFSDFPRCGEKERGPQSAW